MEPGRPSMTFTQHPDNWAVCATCRQRQGRHLDALTTVKAPCHLPAAGPEPPGRRAHLQSVRMMPRCQSWGSSRSPPPFDRGGGRRWLEGTSVMGGSPRGREVAAKQPSRGIQQRPRAVRGGSAAGGASVEENAWRPTGSTNAANLVTSPVFHQRNLTAARRWPVHRRRGVPPKLRQPGARRKISLPCPARSSAACVAAARGAAEPSPRLWSRRAAPRLPVEGRAASVKESCR